METQCCSIPGTLSFYIIQTTYINRAPSHTGALKVGGLLRSYVLIFMTIFDDKQQILIIPMNWQKTPDFSPSQARLLSVFKKKNSHDIKKLHVLHHNSLMKVKLGSSVSCKFWCIPSRCVAFQVMSYTDIGSGSCNQVFRWVTSPNH